MADYTNPVTGGAWPTTPPATYYQTADSFGSCGAPGMVLATVLPNNEYIGRSVNGKVNILVGGQTCWMMATDAKYAKNDGVVTF